MAGGLERSQNRACGRARDVGQDREVFLTEIKIDRRRIGRRQIAASSEAQEHGDAALDVIANEEIVSSANGDIDVSDGRQAEKSLSARVGRHDFPDGGKRQMQEF